VLTSKAENKKAGENFPRLFLKNWRLPALAEATVEEVKDCQLNDGRKDPADDENSRRRFMPCLQINPLDTHNDAWLICSAFRTHPSPRKGLSPPLAVLVS
jgi:hypothetical protein